MNPLVQLDPGLFIWTIITFLVLFFALAKFAWKPLLKMLKDREDMIRDSLDDAEKAKVELERLSEESEAIMAKARSEAQSILAEGKTAAEKVKDDIIAKSKEQANKIREDAENQIQVEKEKAIAEIKGEVVNLTLSVAEKLIQKNLSDADNK
ncbi:MAG: F0F1 ATP synthase subunit B, partial [Candidatus Neomarinimicrobiota bacterium]|nr:F0F1 ATP synthase subunit B [Candidatus Neomarinimicrobiota bacterium]